MQPFEKNTVWWAIFYWGKMNSEPASALKKTTIFTTGSTKPDNCLQNFHASFQWRHNGRDNVPNHQPHGWLLNRLFRRWSKKTSKLRVSGLFAGNSPVTGEFLAQMASNAENVSIWWRHHIVLPVVNKIFIDFHVYWNWCRKTFSEDESLSMAVRMV